MAIEAGLEKVAAGVAAVVIASWAWVWKRQINRIDLLDARIDLLEQERIKKEDLTDMETRLSAVIQMGTAHISERLGDVKQTADKAHERIDDITRK